MRSGRLLNLFVLIFLALSLAPAAFAAVPVEPQDATQPPAGRERPGPQSGIEQIDASTVNSVTPAVLVPGTAVDLCFNVTVASPDKEYMDRFDFNLPDTWTVNSAGDVAGTGCGRGHTFGVEAGNVVYWQTNGYPPQTGCGDWANGTYNFCANVTVPDCSGAPWGLAWNVTGDGYGNPPHGASGIATAACTVQITPPSLAQVLCPDSTATQDVIICNYGVAPLTWSLSEITGTGTLGAAPIPPLRDAPARSDEGAAFPRMAAEKQILTNPVLIVEDDLPWYRWSTQNILTANGIGYDQVGSAQMATVDLTPYALVIVASAQSDAFYTAWNANFARFEAYVAGGGALWIGTATSTAGLTNPLLPGGVVLNDDIYAQYGNVAAPGHPWVAGVSSPFEGLWVSHGEFSNLYPGSIVVATSATTGNPTLVDYDYGAGRVLVTLLTLEIGWDYGWSEAPILQNSLLDMYVPQADIPWLSEAPIDGTVAAGECVTVEVTFDSTGLAPGDYAGALEITTDDPLTPYVTIPVSLTVLAPADITGVTYTPTNLEVAFDATATGAPPLSYLWSFGDGATSDLEDPTHTYAAGGCYTATLAVSNGCGEDTWSEQVCVCDPVSGVDFSWSPLAPLYGETAYFTATVAAGTPPFTYDWDWGDGTAHGSGQYASHAYALPGQYTVILMVANACGQAMMQHTITVTGPDIQVTPTSLSQTLCPDQTATQELEICNLGDGPLTWELSELIGAGTLGTAPIPPTRRGPARSDEPRTFAGIQSENQILGNRVLIFQNYVPWAPSIQAVLSANGIPYDQVGSGSMATIDLSPYELVIVVGAQDAGFYSAWNASLPRFEAYLAGGGALWLSAVPVGSGVLPTLPGGVVLTNDIFNDFNYVAAPGHPWVAGVSSPFYGSYASHGELGNLYPGSIVVTTAAASGNPTLVDYSLGAGRVLITTQPLEYNWAYGQGGAPILQNSLLDLLAWEPGIPWLTEAPITGTVAAGECVTVEVTFDSTGMAPGDYLGELFITSNDPDEPVVTIPVTMTVLVPADITNVTYTATDLQVAFDATAVGAPPFTYLWSFGDGGTSDVEDPTHTYAAGGCYTVTLALTGGCGTDTWTGNVCVCDPVNSAEFTWSPAMPLLNETVTFTATALGTPPFTYTWDLGDGATGSGQVTTHAYAAPGTYTVILTVTNDCGTTTVQHAVTVVVPDIEVTPSSLAQELCPDSTATQDVTICNYGVAPLTWSLSEITGTGTLGAAPIPPLRDAPARSDEGAAFPRMAAEKQILANPVLIVEDDLPWYRWSTQNILTANGIGYDQVGSAQMATVDLTPYALVIVASAQSDAFYTAWNANFARFEAYVAGGGALWIGTATSTAGLTNPLLPGGVVLNDDIYAQYGNVAAPGHPWVAGVSSPFEGLWVSHGEFSNLYPGSIVVATSATTGNPTLVDYDYGAGRVLVTLLTLEIGWDYGWSEAPILQNSLLDMYVPQADIPWLSEAPTGGTVAAGECQTVTVTFDSAGLAPGDYYGDLLIESNDPDEPAITIAVTLTVLAPLGGVDLTWSPLTPLVDQTAYFSATVASGEPPFTFDWDWGDGTAHGSGQYATHVYAAVGTYTVTLTVGNACGTAVVQYPVTVVAPDIEVTPTSLSQELCPDATATQPVTICNTGTAPLTWSLAENPVAGWLGEAPTGSTVQPGECVSVDVTFDSTGLAPGGYSANLVISSDDLDEPTITVPVGLTVLQPADITGVTYTATFLQVAFDATAVGEPPLTYAWSFGDGGISNLEDPTHTYAAGGCYQVSLTVSNGCGQDTWTEQVCVCDPVSGVDYDWSPLVPLVNETVSFTATVAGGTPPFTYDWDWGDGTAHGSGQYAGHAYAATGTYNVILTVTNDCGQAVMQHAVVVIVPNIEVTPSSLAQELCPDATATQQLTICNTGTAPLTWSLSELSGTVKYAGKDVVVHVPAIEAGPKAASRSGSQAFPARDLTVHVGRVSVVPVDVLIVTPDVAGGGDISLLLNTLAAFPDLVVTVWDGSAGTPTVADMQGYDVVFVGNDILWTSSAIDKLVLSDRLADYIDAGGKVLAASFIWSYDDWGMAGGRFLTQDYSPFEMATTDYWDPISLGAFDAGHPIMAGITNVTENYNHQDPALSSNGVWVASWADGENFVGVAPNSVGLNALYLNNANFGGQAGEVLHNALVYLTAAPEDIPWLSEDPISGTVPPGECAVVDVTFDSTGMAPGDYLGSLIIASDDPDTPEVAIPVTLTVLEPATIAGVTYTVTGVEVAFDATVTGAAPLTYAWNFGDGSLPSPVEDPTHVYAATGCYTPTLTVTNGCGQDTWSERICVCEAVAGADFGWVPASPLVGEMIDLTGSIAAGSPPLTWHWDFDDGTTAGGQSVLHAFATPGDHLVTLTVTNGCGQTVVEHTVTVRSSFHYYYVPIVFTGHGTPWPPPDRR